MGIALSILPFGKLADRFAIRPIILVGGLGGRLLGGWIHPPLHWRYAFVSISIRGATQLSDVSPPGADKMGLARLWRV